VPIYRDDRDDRDVQGGEVIGAVSVGILEDEVQDLVRSYRPSLAQADVDRLYTLMAGPSLPAADLPKGLNRPTLELVVRYLLAQRAARSAQQVAEGIGVSRATARRYLEYLESRGQATLVLRYGSAGRPEHRYRAAGSGPSVRACRGYRFASRDCCQGAAR
jgi:hypothetical protein